MLPKFLKNDLYCFRAPVAQWIARPPPKGKVAGSIPARGMSEEQKLLERFFLSAVFCFASCDQRPH